MLGYGCLAAHKTTPDIGIIGGGPAGLRAAEVAAKGDARVTVYDAMPSVGRKFLVAGKSGLNLTNGEDWLSFLQRYRGSDLPQNNWDRILSQFNNEALREWAANLGIETFVASSGKVFPSPVNGHIKAAPLLRKWVEQLRKLGVKFQTRHLWTGFHSDGSLRFRHVDGQFNTQHERVVLALGGASWPKTGSTGNWVSFLEAQGVSINPLVAANCGWEVDWPSKVLEEVEGKPLKNLNLIAGDENRRGELVITRYGLEGGPIYHLGPNLRSMDSPEIMIDFKPDLTVQELIARLGKARRNFVREARRRWKLDAGTASILKHLPNRGPWKSAEQLAHEVKHCRIPLERPRPVAEAISSAGGIRWEELDENLMLRKLPGVFVAGEMIDWEAPTGGYLLQACFATGTLVGKAALNC
jgi:hypothetical protein